MSVRLCLPPSLETSTNRQARRASSMPLRLVAAPISAAVAVERRVAAGVRVRPPAVAVQPHVAALAVALAALFTASAASSAAATDEASAAAAATAAAAGLASAAVPGMLQAVRLFQLR
eukprot:365346-Chlamydomonas_euryale.AAC.15